MTEGTAQTTVNVTDSFGAQFSAPDAAVAEELAVKLVKVDSRFLDRKSVV